MHYLMLAEMGYEVAQYNAAFLLDAGMPCAMFAMVVEVTR
jgi:hypothetical protein